MNKSELQRWLNLEQVGNLRISAFWILLQERNWNLAANERKVPFVLVIKDSLLSALNSNRNQPTVLDPEWALVGNNSFLRERISAVPEDGLEDIDRKVWMTNKMFSFCMAAEDAAGKHLTSSGTAVRTPNTSEATGIQEALWLRQGPKGSGWNGVCQRAIQQRTSVWQHLSDKEGAPQVWQDSQNTAGFNRPGQIYLLRPRGKFLLVLPLWK